VLHPDQLEILPLSKPPSAGVQVPGSKSITNRALVLAALSAKGFTSALRGALRSEDTELMINALRALGFRVLTEWNEPVVFVSSHEEEPLIPAHQADLFVGNSGTTMRFLTAMVSLGQGRYRLDGAQRMRERPIEDLLAVLRQLGVKANSERNNGCPPVIVEADGLKGGRVRIKGDVSSQFLSGLLMAAPFAREEVHVVVEGPLVSEPYVSMTARMLRQWSFFVHTSGTHYQVPGRQGRDLDDLARDLEAEVFEKKLDPRNRSRLHSYDIEPDASAAGYFFAAAAITAGRITVLDIPESSLQGDVGFVDLLEAMGCRVERCSSGITVHGRTLHGIDVDMNAVSDTVMTLAAVACFADGPTMIRNVAHIRHKETDRLAALATELRKVGAEVKEYADGLEIVPRPLHGAEIETYNDHRMAMSMALIGLKVPGIVIRNPGCVAKTYPNFFTDLEKLRA
jgi:3-phosphoshikimate 1-carboxyvinyltransferase